MTENLVVCSKCGTINRLPPSRSAIDANVGNARPRFSPGIRMMSLQKSSNARSYAAPYLFSWMSGHLGADHAA